MSFVTPKELREPIEASNLIRKRIGLKRQLQEQPNLLTVRVAILGGSTTAEVKNMLELFLLRHALKPEFYECGYRRYRETVLFDNRELMQFKPEIVFIHTTWRNISDYPDLMAPEQDVRACLEQEMERFISLWERIRTDYGALIIQNNLDFPALRPLGNLEASACYGRLNYLMRLNAEFARYAESNPRFLVNDILYLSAKEGLDAWHGSKYWYNFHTAVSPTATVALAKNVAGIIKSVYGKSKKCLVLDLDNTLWGGVIGDDGVKGILLGSDHPLGEAFVDFQKYVKNLQRRGIILAVCSKNDPENAKEGFSHPDCVLKFEDFSVFRANWDPKPGNIRAIAAELNIGLDSLVFIDDNPVERKHVSDELPEVDTPEVGTDVSRFAEILEAERYFETTQIVGDDLSRSDYYKANAQRESIQKSSGDYGEFLSSLGMTAEIGPFAPVYLDRIAQLINKTNQFNLTTRRYTRAEVEALAEDPSSVTLYGRLTDRFGDNGLVSLVAGRENEGTLEIDLWLMSCRVLNREMEVLMFDVLVEQCQTRGIRKITGVYIPSKKNAMVADHYEKLGFVKTGAKTGELEERWVFDVPRGTYQQRTRYITRINRQVEASV